MDDNPKKLNKKSDKKVNILAITGWGLLVLTMALAFFLVLTNRLEITVKDPSQIVVLHTSVCKSSVIEKYNSVLNTTTAVNYKNDFKALADEIISLPKYDQDPNCSYILYIYYLYIEDIDNAGKYATNLDEDNKKGDYLSGNLNEIDSIYWVNNKLELYKNNGIKFDKFNMNAAG